MNPNRGGMTPAHGTARPATFDDLMREAVR
jgi:hypothetical protein